jgi:diguanylate cyclase (GGDEF)-like protein
MMDLNAFLNDLTRATFVLLAVLTLVDFARYRGRARLDIALMFASLAVFVVIQAVSNRLDIETRWVDTLGVASALAHPFLMVRLVQHFRDVHAPILRAAMAGLGVSWALAIMFPPPTPLVPSLVIVAYFGGAEAYAAMALVQGARKTGGVVHQRLTLAGMASGLLAAIVLIAGVQAVDPSIADVVRLPSLGLALLSAVGYYLGFSPPRGLRRVWQLREIHRFLDERVGLSHDERSTRLPDRLCQAATRVVGASGSILALKADEGDQLVVRASDHPAVLSTVIALIQNEVKSAKPRRWSLVSAAAIPREIARLIDYLGADTVYAVPITTKERTWGLLVSLCWGQSLFPTDDLNMLTLLAEEGAITLDNVELAARQRRLISQLEATNRELETNLRLQKTLRVQAVRDPLTRLFNRRYLEETFERELRRAERQRKPLGVIMLDLDHFKAFNDTFGHAAGDALLRIFGQFLVSRSRREDVACRYGGEEFVLIFPDAPLDTTIRRAGQLREEAKSLQVQHHGHPLGNVTISVGIAAFPEHGSTTATLLRAADEALYRAKTEGRDRVEAAQRLALTPRPLLSGLTRPARRRGT